MHICHIYDTLKHVCALSAGPGVQVISYIHQTAKFTLRMDGRQLQQASLPAQTRRGTGA